MVRIALDEVIHLPQRLGIGFRAPEVVKTGEQKAGHAELFNFHPLLQVRSSRRFERAPHPVKLTPALRTPRGLVPRRNFDGSATFETGVWNKIVREPRLDALNRFRTRAETFLPQQFRPAGFFVFVDHADAPCLSVHLTRAAFPVGLAQLSLQELACRIARHLRNQVNRLRAFEVCEPLSRPVNHALRIDRMAGPRRTRRADIVPMRRPLQRFLCIRYRKRHFGR